MAKTKVAILYGGRSVEHGVSVNSARNIFEFIDRKKFTPIPIGITQKGKWHLTKDVSRNIQKGKGLSLELDPRKPVLKAGSTRVVADVVFPVLHGTDGEDGSIQGLLKALDLPLVGTGVLGSSLSMNKIVAKRLLREAGIPVTDFIPLGFHDKARPAFEAIKSKLGLPFMVKSASLGSSVGVTKVKSKSEFAKAVEESFRYDHELLFEKYVKGREIECAVLGNAPPKASLPGEIIISKNYEFYTFNAKYVDSEAVKIDVPAVLPPEVVEQVRALSVRAFQTLKCEDYARVDLFYTESGEIYVNEINTIPGFTNSSMYPMMWKERGISFTDLITTLVNLALERTTLNDRIQHNFASSLKF
ncbi:MAG TPA: D-alanine--D-alanine ligase family protein [Cyclobacteriaceae bacterium]|nr:D-alanine--D-alanine ligase family protein [Cyclobacteriaceae bacterium]